ncbi:NADH dehydrogenase (ubiquinone) B18 subunit [Calliopsis andreniformis]|uniref:NADH dehydrogenase (ubiquinone) B18 subunit n=1 Tax=Calliopsis andreniformis TaxID=337506 RepID=UPI003FCCC10E
MGNVLKPLGNREDFPDSNKPPTMDPHIGFPKGRKERVMIATEKEMRAANVPKNFRDYCAHKFIEYQGCERLHFPFVYRCNKQFDEYAHCEVEDSILRMKEYERERRLRRRQRKKEQAMKAAS